MPSLLKKIYWKAPYFVKDRIASINTRKLDRWRYGPDYYQILTRIAEHDKWTTDQFYEYHERRLCSLLQHVAVKVPYYRKTFLQAQIDPGSIKCPEDLPRLPILEKQAVRSETDSLLDQSLDKNQLVVSHTSGTTGTPLDIYRDAWLCSAQFAYLDARWHKVAGMSRRINRSVSIGGHLVAAPGQTKPPFWVYNHRWNQLYMSSYHLSPEYLGYYVNELRKFKADYIEGYPSSVYAIAQHIVDNNLGPVPLKACFTTAETLFDHQREAISRAFCCRTYDQYGCAEMVVFAAECEHGSLHLSPEFGIVEVLDENDEPIPPGQTGQLVCTSLINRVQPFIRYRLGDIGSLRKDSCSCESSLPMLGQIEGRADSVLITRDGRKIGNINPVGGTKGIVEAQVVQDDYDNFRIRIVPSNDYNEKDGKRVINNLSEQVGRAKIKIELTRQIERTSSGKFKAVVCSLHLSKGCLAVEY